ncbi:protein NDUFAF4 homolog [Teleopsis dalmanni]|uniref:protein NDUFAF4 homolog n=1 Tax=Teleopsis dalmanni TaxID=139649 RepID=UPI0018CE135B|nr:protein NDUFAF4 homolog [Teleopsis dalmanni]
MGNVRSMLSRRINRFNVENRAHRFLDREKTAAAPKFESNIKDMQRALELDPNLKLKLESKDSALDERLKRVYVTSEDKFVEYPITRTFNPDRPLPLDRTTPEFSEYGHVMPREVARGRCTLKQAIDFITDHNSEPEVWTKQRIAQQYKMKEPLIDDILTYFKSFNVHIPENTWDKHLTQAQIKQIDAKDSNSTK